MIKVYVNQSWNQYYFDELIFYGINNSREIGEQITIWITIDVLATSLMKILLN